MKIVEDYKFDKKRFGIDVAPQLLAQTVRVYLANQRQGNASVQTRAQVTGTNKKMYKQKGTGHARHSDDKAPIFVGGGVAHGPKVHDFSLKLSRKMRNLALKGALTLKNKEKKVVVVSGLGKLTGKTKELADFLQWEEVLVVTNKYLENVYRAGRNISGVKIMPVGDLNAYEVMKAKNILWDEDIDSGSGRNDKTATRHSGEEPKATTPKSKKKMTKRRILDKPE